MEQIELIKIQLSIEELFLRIKLTIDVSQAENYFQSLEKLQFKLAEEIFSNGLKVNEFLRKFVYNFDRIDDEELKLILYDKIKSITLNFANNFE